MNSNILNETFDKHLRLLKSKLNEEENPTLSQNITQPDNIDTETKVKLSALMNKKFDEGFVNKLKELISDEKVRQFLNAAKIDGNLKDDKITVTGDPNGTAVKVDGLSATQSEVFLDKSIGFPIEKGLSDQIKHFILQGSAPSGFPPIVISGKYVIDGHHRWSQVFCWNYESTIPAVSIEFEGQSNPDELLKKIHLTIAAQRGSVPLEDKGGTLNLFTLNQTQLFEWLNEKLTAFPKIIDEVFKDSAVKRKMMDRIKSQNVDDSNNTKYIETLITPYIFTNIQAIKEKKGNHPRKIMPQTEKDTSLPAYFGKLKTGDINVDVNEIFQRHLKLLHNKLNLNENVDINQVASTLEFKPVTKQKLIYKYVEDVKPSSMPPMTYTKSKGKQNVVTTTTDGKETQNVAEDGDIIMSGATGENYVIKGAKFSKLYHGNVGEDVYPEQSPRQVALYTGGETKFKAPWGEDMVIKPGDYLVKDPANTGYYRIAKVEFEKTYNKL